MKTSNISNRLKELMSEFDITQKDICAKTGISKGAISQYVNGGFEPKHDRVGMISEAYGVDPAWLMGYDVPMYGKNSEESAVEDFEVLDKFSRLSKRDKQLIMNMIDSMLSGEN